MDRCNWLNCTFNKNKLNHCIRIKCLSTSHQLNDYVQNMKANDLILAHKYHFLFILFFQLAFMEIPFWSFKEYNININIIYCIQHWK